MMRHFAMVLAYIVVLPIRLISWVYIRFDCAFTTLVQFASMVVWFSRDMMRNINDETESVVRDNDKAMNSALWVMGIAQWMVAHFPPSFVESMGIRDIESE
jgi:hypothetical protein